jgi:predicted nucleic acid-binding protein
LSYLLDTTALVAHALDEAGGKSVQALFDDGEHALYISALSLFELAGVLKSNGAADKIPACWETYRQTTEVVPVDAGLAQMAWELRESARDRIPISDAIIAATARSRGATLVHRDRHLALIPPGVVRQLQLTP